MSFGFRAFNAGIVTRWLDLPEISPDPAHPIGVQLRHAGSTNPAWDSWQLRQPARPDAKEPTTAEGRAAERARNRASNCEALAEAVLAGWRNVSEDGKPVEFMPEAAQRFLAELAENCPDVITRIFLFASAISNFRGAADVDALGKG